MKTWLTECWVSNEVGRVHRICGEIEAETKQDAEAFARQLGLDLLGELVGEIDAPEMDGFCEQVIKERDEEWLKGQEAVDED